MPPKVESPMPVSDQSGFALIEVIVSAVVVVIMAAGTLIAIQSTQRTSAEERHRATAHGIAQEDQARMRAFRISSLANYNETRTVNADDGTYTVDSRADFVTDSTGTASCEQNTAAADYIRISSTVTWPSIGPRPPIVIQSIVAPPNGAIAANRGALAIAVKGGADQPIPNISLSGTGAGSFSGATSENGCVIFGNLPAGNYTLTTNAPGYVDKDGETPGSVSTSVVALSTNTLALQYDEPGAAEIAVHDHGGRPARSVECRVRGRLQHRHDRGADLHGKRARQRPHRRAALSRSPRQTPSTRAHARPTIPTPKTRPACPGRLRRRACRSPPGRYLMQRCSCPL